MSTNVKVFAIGGNWRLRNLTCTGDCYVGTATDTTTLTSLIELVEHQRGYSVSLHGQVNGETVSGEMGIGVAKKWVHELVCDVIDVDVLAVN